MNEIVLKLDKFETNGGTIGESLGKKFIVFGGIPNEIVKIKVFGKKGNHFLGEVLEIVKPSPLRIKEKEDHYLSCSPWQILKEDSELDYKKVLIKDIFKKYKLPIPNFDLYSNETFFGYRNKMEFSFLDDEISLSFFKRGTHKKKIKVDKCLLALDSINSEIENLLNFLKDNNFKPKDLKSVIFRGNKKGDVLFSLFIKSNEINLKEDLKSENIKGFNIFFSDPKSPASIKTNLLYSTGKEYILEEILGKKFYISSTSFFQVNIEVFEEALNDIKKYLLDEDKIYDIYCGVGTIGISLKNENINFIESEEENFNLLKLNCEYNGVKKFKIINDRAENVINDIDENSLLIFDPPREGLHKKVLQGVLGKRFKRIIYLSCNPESQIRDFSFLKDKYSLIFFKGYNFFPRTPHIETLMILDRKI